MTYKELAEARKHVLQHYLYHRHLHHKEEQINQLREWVNSQNSIGNQLGNLPSITSQILNMKVTNNPGGNFGGGFFSGC